MSQHDLDEYNRQQQKRDNELYEMRIEEQKYASKLKREKQEKEEFKKDIVIILVAILIAVGVTWIYEYMWEEEGGFNLKTFIPILALVYLSVKIFHKELLR